MSWIQLAELKNIRGSLRAICRCQQGQCSLGRSANYPTRMSVLVTLAFVVIMPYLKPG